MDDLADRLDRLTVRASTPDGRITAEFHDRTEVTIWFAAGAYIRFEREDLQRQLENLAKILSARRSGAYYQVVSEVSGRSASREITHGDHQSQEFYSRRDRMIAQGISADDQIRIFAQGMSRWRVHLAEEALETLSEQDFIHDIQQAAKMLIADQYRGLNTLRQEIYMPTKEAQ